MIQTQFSIFGGLHTHIILHKKLLKNIFTKRNDQSHGMYQKLNNRTKLEP
jgi:hypothetical protein